MKHTERHGLLLDEFMAGDYGGLFSDFLVMKLIRCEKRIEPENTDAATLAALVLEYLPAGRLRPTTPPQIVARMLELARRIAPESEIISGSGVWSSVNGFVPDNPHDPSSYRLENSPAQTGEAGAARFVKDGK